MLGVASCRDLINRRQIFRAVDIEGRSHSSKKIMLGAALAANRYAFACDWKSAPAGDCFVGAASCRDLINPRQIFRAVDIEGRFLTGDSLYTFLVGIDNRPRAAVAGESQ